MIEEFSKRLERVEATVQNIVTQMGRESPETVTPTPYVVERLKSNILQLQERTTALEKKTQDLEEILHTIPEASFLPHTVEQVKGLLERMHIVEADLKTVDQVCHQRHATSMVRLGAAREKADTVTEQIEEIHTTLGYQEERIETLASMNLELSTQLHKPTIHPDCTMRRFVIESESHGVIGEGVHLQNDTCLVLWDNNPDAVCVYSTPDDINSGQGLSHEVVYVD